MQEIADRYKIKHRKSTPYHPQANGQVESTNKTLETIMTKTIQMHRNKRLDKLHEALWAYIITWKNSTGCTPYQLVYGKQVLLPIEFQIHTFKLAGDLGVEIFEAHKERIMQLNQLDEMRQAAVEQTILVQQQRAQWHDKFIKKKQFKVGDWALYLIQSSKKLKLYLKLIGLGHMRFERYMIMAQSNFKI